MSWQTYVDVELVGSGAVSQAAICGVEAGDTWATSPDFTVSVEEAQALVAGLADQTHFLEKGITLNGVKYMFIRAEADQEVHGKKGVTGCCIFKGKTFLLICVHDDTIQPAQCSAAGERLAHYLSDDQGL